MVVVATGTSKSVVSLSGYKRDLHNAVVGLLTPSTNDHDYMLVDGRLSRMARRLVSIKVETYPNDFMDAHRTLISDLRECGAWVLLGNHTYPAWVVGTLLQVRGQMPGVRTFRVMSYPQFVLQEFMNH